MPKSKNYIQIRSRWDGALIYAGGATTEKEALERACHAGINLSGADLTGVRLVDAHLAGARLARANLAGADLSEANLAGADLAGADLAGADLAGADLSEANLSEADLSDAWLLGADLAGSRLVGTNLAGAYLVDTRFIGAIIDRTCLIGANLFEAGFEGVSQLEKASLAPIKEDLWKILDAAPAEVGGLLCALREGRINGNDYEGKCACLVGTLAQVRGVFVDQLPGIALNCLRPAERWFLAIREGHTPTTSLVAFVTDKWIVEWQVRAAKSLIHTSAIQAPF